MPDSEWQVWCVLSYEEPRFHKRGREEKNEERDQQRPAEMGGDIEGIMKGKNDQSTSYIHGNYNNEL